MDTLLHTGDTRPTQAGGHCCRMFRWRELAEMIAAQPCRLLAASASNAISLADPEVLDRLAADPGCMATVLGLGGRPGAGARDARRRDSYPLRHRAPLRRRGARCRPVLIGMSALILVL